MSEGTSGNGNASGGQEAAGKWDAELQALIEGTAGEAQFREPTADERGKVAKQAQKKRDSNARKQTRQLEKRARSQQRAVRRAARRRIMLRRTAWGVSAIVLAGACVFAYAHFGHSLTGAGGPDDTQTVTNSSAVPTTSAMAVSPLTDSGPPANPFQGSPADKWANGTAGVTIPAAAPHGQYSAGQVESAYQITKRLLTAAALDKQSLLGGAPTAFANLLTQDQRSQFIDGLDKIGVDKTGWPLSSRATITQFAPGTTKLIGAAIKVHGMMRAEAAKSSQGYPMLRVKVAYIMAYAVEPPRAPADWMRIVTQFDGSVDFGNWAGANTSFEPWWNMKTSVAGFRCGMKDGFIHPDYPTGPSPSVQPTGKVIDPYSLGQQPTGCQATTGT